MGNCIFCSEPAGFLRRSHQICKDTNTAGKARITSLISEASLEGENLRQLEKSIEQIATASYIDKGAMHALTVAGWEKAVDSAFADGILSEAEEKTLSELQKHFSLSQSMLDRNGAFTKVAKGAVLRDLLDGEFPERVKIEGNLPFNLQKTEKLAWLFQDVRYYEEKTRTRYVGGSQGVSIRIAKGSVLSHWRF